MLYGPEGPLLVRANFRLLYNLYQVYNPKNKKNKKTKKKSDIKSDDGTKSLNFNQSIPKDLHTVLHLTN